MRIREPGFWRLLWYWIKVDILEWGARPRNIYQEESEGVVMPRKYAGAGSVGIMTDKGGLAMELDYGLALYDSDGLIRHLQLYVIDCPAEKRRPGTARLYYIRVRGLPPDELRLMLEDLPAYKIGSTWTGYLDYASLQRLFAALEDYAPSHTYRPVAAESHYDRVVEQLMRKRQEAA